MIQDENGGGSGEREVSAHPHPEVRDLERTLEAIRFSPRASLEAEIYGRLRREGRSTGGSDRRSWLESVRGGRRRLGVATALAAAVAALFVWPKLVDEPSPVSGPAMPLANATLDRCCADLDGGGIADDGVLVETGANEAVLGFAIYEDMDGSGDFSEADVVRAGPEAPSTPAGPLPSGAITSDHCCGDYDAGGSADDGILLIGVPPDRILVAAVYEDRDASGNVSAEDVVRYMLP